VIGRAPASLVAERTSGVAIPRSSSLAVPDSSNRCRWMRPRWRMQY